MSSWTPRSAAYVASHQTVASIAKVLVQPVIGILHLADGSAESCKDVCMTLTQLHAQLYFKCQQSTIPRTISPCVMVANLCSSSPLESSVVKTYYYNLCRKKKGQKSLDPKSRATRTACDAENLAMIHSAILA